MTIGMKIKKARKKAGLTQKELGEKLDVKQQTIAMFENDKTNIKLATLKRIADVLEIPALSLLDEAPEIALDKFDDILQMEHSQDQYLWKIATDCFHAAYVADGYEVETMDINESEGTVQISISNGNKYRFTMSEFEAFFLDILEYFKFKLSQKTAE